MNWRNVIKNRFSYPILYLYIRPKAYLHWMNSDMRKLLSDKHKPVSDKTSVVFFSAPKCASVYLLSIIGKLAENQKMTHIDFETYFFQTGIGQLMFSDEKFLNRVFRSHGYCYGVFRMYHNIPRMDMYRIILHLRDPRDVLVSYYYSMAYSHPLSTGKLIAKRKKALKMNLDEYVLDTALLFKNIYQTYCDKMLGESNVLFLKYEDMISGFEVWLDKLTAFTGLRASRDTLDHFLQSADFKVEKEDVYSHKRIITPGDYKNKLKEITIRKLNEIFHKELSMLGYEN